MIEPYITTYTGRKMHFMCPDPDEICIEDIAHSLACQCRFTGHVRTPYSTAEHSVRVSQICDPKDALAGLLHDGGETYMADISRPVKYSLDMDNYRQLENRIQDLVYTAFGLPTGKPESVEIADKIMLGIEARDLMHLSVLSDTEWAKWIDPVRNRRDINVSFPWSSAQAEWEFLLRYYQLTYDNKKRAKEAPHQ